MAVILASSSGGAAAVGCAAETKGCGLGSEEPRKDVVGVGVVTGRKFCTRFIECRIKKSRAKILFILDLKLNKA